MKRIVKPDWLTEGPNDEEYKTYRLLGRVDSLKKNLENGNLEEVLVEIEANLDYLYMYDAIKASEEELALMGGLEDGAWKDLELVYNTPVIEVDRDDVVDKVYEEALSKFEDLHALVRALWQDLESQISHSYFYKKPHLINDGFLFVILENVTTLVFSFQKPTKYTKNWRDFHIDQITIEDYSDESINNKISELLSADSDKVLMKLMVDTAYQNGILEPILRCYVYNCLRRDYGF